MEFLKKTINKLFSSNTNTNSKYIKLNNKNIYEYLTKQQIEYIEQPIYCNFDFKFKLTHKKNILWIINSKNQLFVKPHSLDIIYIINLLNIKDITIYMYYKNKYDNGIRSIHLLNNIRTEYYEGTGKVILYNEYKYKTISHNIIILGKNNSDRYDYKLSKSKSIFRLKTHWTGSYKFVMVYYYNKYNIYHYTFWRCDQSSYIRNNILKIII